MDCSFNVAGNGSWCADQLPLIEGPVLPPLFGPLRVVIRTLSHGEWTNILRVEIDAVD